MTNSLIKRLGGFPFILAGGGRIGFQYFFEGGRNILPFSWNKTPRLCFLFFLLILAIRHQGKPVQTPYLTVGTREKPKIYNQEPGFHPAKTHTNPIL